ncbi:MAG: YeeE/YedE thiosulfate transporter family protein [Halothiobacillaceae bacterium]
MASLLFVAVTLAYALSRGLVALTGLPLGFLFGFFLHKGDLCVASAFSEVLLMRDGRKVWGMWVCIVTSMVVFATLDLMGLVTLAPKPMLWLSYLVGGAIFGAATILSNWAVTWVYLMGGGSFQE